MHMKDDECVLNGIIIITRNENENEFKKKSFSVIIKWRRGEN